MGERLRSEVLGGERARYGDKLMARLGEQLAQEFGRGFEAKSWTHFLQLLPLKTSEARHFYAHQAVTERWSVRASLSTRESLYRSSLHSGLRQVGSGCRTSTSE